MIEIHIKEDVKQGCAEFPVPYSQFRFSDVFSSSVPFRVQLSFEPEDGMEMVTHHSTIVLHCLHSPLELK